MPERTFCGVRVWCWPRVPTEAMGWTVGTRGTRHPEPGLTPSGRPGTDSFRNGDPAALAGYKSQAATIPWSTPPSHCCWAIG
jgi:hypothetical protein